MFNYEQRKTEPPKVSFKGRVLGTIQEDGIIYMPGIKYVDKKAEPSGEQPLNRIFLGRVATIALGLEENNQDNKEILFPESVYSLKSSNNEKELKIGSDMAQHEKTSGILTIEPMWAQSGRVKLIFNNAVVAVERPMKFASDEIITRWVIFTAFPDTSGEIIEEKIL